MEITRNLRKTLLGTVVSDKMDKTVVVKIERRIPHPRYKRYYKRSSNVVAHPPSEQDEALAGL
jgi:small subunit ribosomal protein S17